MMSGEKSTQEHLWEIATEAMKRPLRPPESIALAATIVLLDKICDEIGEARINALWRLAVSDIKNDVANHRAAAPTKPHDSVVH